MKLLDIISEEKRYTPEQNKTLDRAKKILSVFKSGRFTPKSDYNLDVKYRLLDTPDIWYSRINKHAVIELTEKKWSTQQPLFEFIIVNKMGEETLVTDKVVYSYLHMSIGKILSDKIEKFNIRVVLTQFN